MTGMNTALFKFKTQVRVRNYEIDWQGIVHNAIYLLYFETARIEYLKALGLSIDLKTIPHDYKVVLVRNEIDYRSPARFDEILNVFARISYIRDTSFAFEGYIEDDASKRLIAENVAVHVWLDPRTNEPQTIDDEFRKAVQRFEGSNVAIEWKSLYT